MNTFPSEPNLPDPVCGQPTRACFTVVMRAYDPDNLPTKTDWTGGIGARWMKPPVRGLDTWAQTSKMRKQASANDKAAGTLNNMPWHCYNGKTNATDVRRWEIAGRKAGTPAQIQARTSKKVIRERRTYYKNIWPYIVSAVMFHGWEGGNGFTDCEPLYKAFDDDAFVGTDANGVGKERSKSFGAFATLDLNLGFQKGMAEK